MPRRAAMLMILYAVTMVALGLLAYSIAPEGANAKTAIISSGGSAVLMVACAILTMMLPRNRRLGMIGIHIGLILPVLFAMTFFWRGSIGFQTSGRYSASLDLVEAAAVTPSDEIPAALAVRYLSLSEMADLQEAREGGKAKRVEELEALTNTRRATVDRVISNAVAAREVELSDPQRRLAEAYLIPLARTDDLVDHDKAYAGRVLTVLFGVSLAFFAAILMQRGKATQGAVPVARSAKTARASGTPASESVGSEDSGEDTVERRETGDAGRDDDAGIRVLGEDDSDQTRG